MAKFLFLFSSLVQLSFYFFIFLQRLRIVLSPTEDWGPAQPADRKRYLASRGICDLETVETLTGGAHGPIYKGHNGHSEEVVLKSYKCDDHDIEVDS
jgi:hypothetical protein